MKTLKGFFLSTNLLLFRSLSVKTRIDVELFRRVSHRQLADFRRIFSDAFEEVVQLAHRRVLDGLADPGNVGFHLFRKSANKKVNTFCLDFVHNL